MGYTDIPGDCEGVESLLEPLRKYLTGLRTGSHFWESMYKCMSVDTETHCQEGVSSYPKETS